MFQDSHFQRKQLILNMINHLGPISRTSLIEHTAYRPATVGAIVTELIDQKLVVESGFHSSGQGRKRALLEINKEHICAIGIYFSSRHITYVLSQFDGGVLEHSRTKYSHGKSTKELVAEVAEYVEKMLLEYPNKKFVGIGICKPLVDPSTYRANSANTDHEFFSEWIYDDLSPRLEKLTSLPVEVYSGVTLPAQAEYSFGVAKGVDNFIWVELSNGIGTSIFCNGDAVKGADGMAGELGHTSIATNCGEHKLCYCGNPNCVEAIAAWPALEHNIRNELTRGVISTLKYDPKKGEKLTVDQVREAISAGDRMCMYYAKKAAEQIGAAIANAVTLLNPQMIVLYGFMLDLGDFFVNALGRAIRENVVYVSSDFEIRISTTSESIMPLGAIANIFSSYLRSDDYKWVYQLETGESDFSEDIFVDFE